MCFFNSFHCKYRKCADHDVYEDEYWDDDDDHDDCDYDDDDGDAGDDDADVVGGGGGDDDDVSRQSRIRARVSPPSQ